MKKIKFKFGINSKTYRLSNSNVLNTILITILIICFLLTNSIETKVNKKSYSKKQTAALYGARNNIINKQDCLDNESL